MTAAFEMANQRLSEELCLKIVELAKYPGEAIKTGLCHLSSERQQQLYGHHTHLTEHY
jgi:hypothetical protein